MGIGKVRAVGLVVVGLGLGACGEGAGDSRFVAPDWSGLAQVPPSYGGCGDVELYASNLADDKAVFVGLPGWATDAAMAGGTVQATIALPDPGVSVVARSGSDLTSATCVGAFPWPGPTVDRQFEAVGGTLQARVTPDAGATPSLPVGTADLRLLGVTFVEPATGASFTAPDVTLQGVFVGLYPP